VHGASDGGQQGVHAVRAQSAGLLQGNLGLGGRAGLVRGRTGRLGPSQAHLSYRDAAFGTNPPRAATDGGEPPSRSGGQPQRPEGLARSQGRRTLGPRQGTGLSKTQPRRTYKAFLAAMTSGEFN